MIKIVTDSTASLPRELCRLLDITVIPLTVHFGSTTFVDGVDPAEQFYDQLLQSEAPPTTSTPSPGTFLETYRKLAEKASTIISLHVMGTKSATVSSARMAADMLPESNIHVIDSNSVSLGLGLLTITAARMAQMGETADRILHSLEQMIPKVDVWVAIKDMRELRKSGRVSLGQALVAGVLAIKPVLTAGHGLIEVVDKVRGFPRAVDAMVESAKERVGEAKVLLAVVHTNAEAEAHELLEQIKHRFNYVEAMVADAGPALASHAGPGALGLVTVQVEG